MGFRELFSGGKRRGCAPSVRGSDASEPSAIEYVEWLLKHMLRTSCTELVITADHALPGSRIDAGDDYPPCIPPVETVFNRLKILSGLNPIRHSGVVDGSFEWTRANHTVVFSTQFNNTVEKSICTIRLRIRPRHG